VLRFVILSIAFLMLGCSGELDRRIKIVLPNDYRGEFTIVKDKDGTGIGVTPDYYIYTVPPAGELRTPDITPFFKLHQTRIEYLDGRILVDLGRELKSNEGVTIKDLGTTAGSRKTGPNSSEGSTEFDGTTMRWKVVAASEAP